MASSKSYLDFILNQLSELENIEQIIKTLAEDKNLKILWKDYQDKFKYAQNIEYEKIIKAIELVENIITK